MKLQTLAHKVERGGDVELTDVAFTIKSTAKAFSILSSGLYSNKILAIIRELSCNAYDSHVVAGCTTIPFLIKLPNLIDPTFSVTDYGTGLSHEDVLNLYSTYFDSSKTNDNNLIGALGLGSKSPFSYTSTFNVESRFAGVKRYYVAFINQQGIPSIALTNSEPTTETSGMKITLSVKTKDIQEFYSAAERALQHFPVFPTIIGVQDDRWELTHQEYLIKQDTWGVRPNSQRSGAHIIQGNVSYPIDEDSLQSPHLTETELVLLSSNIDLFVPIGTVDVAASREQLSYTQISIKNILKVISASAAQLVDHFNQDINSCCSFFSANVRLAALMSNHAISEFVSTCASEKLLSYKNIELNAVIAFDQTSIKNTKVSLFLRGKNTSSPIARKWEISADSTVQEKETSVQIKPHTRVIIVDKRAKNRVVLKQLFEHPDRSSRDVALIVLHSTLKQYQQRETLSPEIKRLLSTVIKCQPTEVIFYSSLPVEQREKSVVPSKSARVPRKGTALFLGKEFKYTSRSALCADDWIRDDVDLTQPAVYVNIEKYQVRYNDKFPNINFKDLISAARKFDLLKDVDIVGLTSKQILQINGDWIEVYQYVIDQLQSTPNKNLISTGIALGMFERARYGIKQAIMSSVNKKLFDAQLQSGPFKRIVNAGYKYWNQHGSDLKYYVERLNDILVISKQSIPTSPLFDDINQLSTIYPLFDIIDWRGLTPEADLDKVIDYINSCQITVECS